MTQPIAVGLYFIGHTKRVFDVDHAIGFFAGIIFADRHALFASDSSVAFM